MNDQHTDNASNDRPSSSELLGTSKTQINRQGKRKEEKGTSAPPENTSRLLQTFTGLASITLVILGLIALAAWGWIALNTEEAPKAPAIVPPQFIYTETTREIQLATSTDVASKIDQFEAIVDVQTGGFSQFYFTKQQGGQLRLVTPQAFFTQLSLNDPGPLFTYVGDTFMYGQHAVSDAREEQYLILPTTNEQAAYGQLLQSEDRVVNLLEPLGFPDVDSFSDTIIRNQDVRFGTSTTGSVYWSLPQPDRLVITTSEETLRAIFNRLQQVRRNQ